MSSTEKIRVSLIITFLFLCICFPLFFAKPMDWIYILVLLLGLMLPIVAGGLLLSKQEVLQKPIVKFVFTWILSGFTIFFLSSLMLILTNNSLEDSLMMSAKLGLLALGIILLLYPITLVLRRVFSGLNKK